MAYCHIVFDSHNGAEKMMTLHHCTALRRTTAPFRSMKIEIKSNFYRFHHHHVCGLCVCRNIKNLYFVHMIIEKYGRPHSTSTVWMRPSHALFRVRKLGTKQRRKLHWKSFGCVRIEFVHLPSAADGIAMLPPPQMGKKTTTT